MANKYGDPIGEGALWEKETQKGDTYFSGNLEFSPAPGAPPIKVQFVAFGIQQKTSDRSPDYRIIVNTCGPAPARSIGPPKGRSAAPPVSQGEDQDDEDTPF